jgi:hypothetical protein
MEQLKQFSVQFGIFMTENRKLQRHDQLRHKFWREEASFNYYYL